ncbi:hypothetical protein M431DRAFT_199416 [Trichoderma harzianum CBS 226.95]|uniref:SWIM-type domain-containing protein n=1 Tax=Trichoderma harzianum CBS 226.95 TaxID=983964 RepID=A0A2T4AV02_TRIHA|nr:hypothetical protein M431DRAFT_199416 [Trichoderma harzianum CBS 226.95]PTB60896.1 hypothetical protein M431DRAFT_199416 [Trichoderma harzianum CBS 226.95]
MGMDHEHGTRLRMSRLLSEYTAFAQANTDGRLLARCRCNARQTACVHRIALAHEATEHDSIELLDDAVLSRGCSLIKTKVTAEGPSAVCYAHPVRTLCLCQLGFTGSRVGQYPLCKVLLHSAEGVELGMIPGCDIWPSLHKAVARLMFSAWTGNKTPQGQGTGME